MFNLTRICSRTVTSVSDFIFSTACIHMKSSWASKLLSTHLIQTNSCSFLLLSIASSTIIEKKEIVIDDCNGTRTHNNFVRKGTLDDRVFAYELSGCGFENRCSHLNFRFRACFEQGVPWDSGNYRVWTHSERRTWHDKSINSIVIDVFSNISWQSKRHYLKDFILWITM